MCKIDAYAKLLTFVCLRLFVLTESKMHILDGIIGKKAKKVTKSVIALDNST